MCFPETYSERSLDGKQTLVRHSHINAAAGSLIWDPFRSEILLSLRQAQRTARYIIRYECWTTLFMIKALR